MENRGWGKKMISGITPERGGVCFLRKKLTTSPRSLYNLGVAVRWYLHRPRRLWPAGLVHPEERGGGPGRGVHVPNV